MSGQTLDPRAKSMLLIENGTLYTPMQVISDGVVLIQGRQIEAVGKRGEVAIPTDAQHLDAGGGYIVPGFVNMHIHGIGGYEILDGESSHLQAMSRMLARHGVASWVPTIGSAPIDVMERALSTVREARRSKIEGAEILGAHIEGRYLSPHERGAHALDLLAEPRPEEHARWFEYADVIRVFTLAPELPGALELIGALYERGILVSAGHSIAIDSELSRAVDAGLSHATHMFCNMGTLRRVNIRRVAGLVESALLEDRITTEIIADGYHIAPSLMNLALKIKGPERLAIVTDGSQFTGMPPGRYHVHGQDVIVEENITFVADRSAYFGSVATMDHCLRCAIETMELALPDALRMVSLTPATILGIANRKGSLEAGKDADIVVLDNKLRVMCTVIGDSVFDAKVETRMQKQDD